MDFSLIKKSGITQQEFAELVGVGRVTVNLWVRGKMKPNTEVQATVLWHLDMLDHALENGDLPPPDDLRPRSRGPHIKRALIAARRAIREAA